MAATKWQTKKSWETDIYEIKYYILIWIQKYEEQRFSNECCDTHMWLQSQRFELADA